jgi:CRP-like cAMP-binding protein
MKDPVALGATIRATSAFREITEDDVAYLIGVGELARYAPEAFLMLQGEEAHDAALILEGEVTVIADSPRGAVPIGTLVAPCLVGELGALARLRRSATIRARTPVTVLRIGRSALAEVARTTPSLLIDVIGRMGDRLRRLNDAIGLYTHALDAFDALGRRAFDPALLDELRSPIPDLADFGHTFGRMADEILLRRQRSDEMASAAVIQRALLPKPAAFATNAGVDVSASMTAARDVGGDWFELVQLADGRVVIGVGDVCGKGVPAALFTGVTKTLIRINLRETPDLSGAIFKANAYLAGDNAADLFATLIYAAYDPATGDAELVSCGHPPALLRRADGTVEKLSGGGLPVGLFESLKLSVTRVELRPGDCLLLYTDGVTEAENMDGVGFGEESLAELLAQESPCAASAWIGRVEDAVRRHAGGRAQFDDVTCAALVR